MLQLCNKDDDDEVEVMDDDSDENDDIPTINVGGEDYDLTDVTPDVIAKMSPEEMEKYNQLYQDFYKDMYDWKVSQYFANNLILSRKSVMNM